MNNGDEIIGEVVTTEHDDQMLFSIYRPLQLRMIFDQNSNTNRMIPIPCVDPAINTEQIFDFNFDQVMLSTNVITEPFQTVYEVFWKSYDNIIQDKESENRHNTSLKDKDEDISISYEPYDGQKEPTVH